MSENKTSFPGLARRRLSLEGLDELANLRAAVDSALPVDLVSRFIAVPC